MSAAAKQRAYRQRLHAGVVIAKDLPAASPIPTIPSSARWRELRRQAIDLLCKLQAEMEDYQADRSEEWLESERGGEFQERLDLMSEILESLESLD